jgi:CPA1 family monovalent cation:H+ antiporter
MTPKIIMMKTYRHLLLISILGAFFFSSCSSEMIYQDVPRQPGTIIIIEEVVIGLLLVAAIVSIATQRLNIPYTVGLVLVGFGLAIFRKGPIPFITPELILALLVPPLIFDAAYQLKFSDFRRDLPYILALAVPGVIITTLLVGLVVSFGAGIALPFAMVFGALIAATDPVAVIALFRTLGVPKRLRVVLEGESLLNDGTAIVIFSLMVEIALTGHFNLENSVLKFLIISGGGILVGGILGYLISRAIKHIDDYLVETTLTTVLAYGAYLIAEYFFGVSGVLAVVAAGLASGEVGPKGMSPTTKIVVNNFWEFAAFLANSFIFLIIGLQIEISMLISNASAIFWSILAVLVARIVTVYGLSLINKTIPYRWKNVLFWGGLRGAISLALALSLSNNFPYRAQLQAMAFGVVLFTLIVEGLTMKPLINFSGLIPKNINREEYEIHHAKAIAIKAAYARLTQLNREGLISDYTWQKLKPAMERELRKLMDGIQSALDLDPSLHEEELSDAWRESLQSQKSTLTDLFRNNILPEDIYIKLVSEIDLMLVDPENSWSEGLFLEDERGVNRTPQDKG